MAIVEVGTHTKNTDTVDSGASQTTAVTLDGSATFALVWGCMYNGSGDTITATFDSASPDFSWFDDSNGNDVAYVFGFDSPTAGSEVDVVVSGGDSGDNWHTLIQGFTGVATGSSSVETEAVSVSTTGDVTSQSDSECFGLMWSDTGWTAENTEIDTGGGGDPVSWQTASGTGGEVSMDWTGGSGTIYVVSRFNLVAAAAATRFPYESIKQRRRAMMTLLTR